MHAFTTACLVVVFLFNQSTNSKDEVYRKAVELGKAQAEAEIRDEAITIYCYSGGGLRQIINNLDDDTYLFKKGFGDFIDPHTSGLIDGHNKVIYDHMKKHGLPKYSFIKYKDKINNIKSYFDEQSKVVKPIRITVNHPLGPAGDRKVEIELIDRSRSKPGIGGSANLYLTMRWKGDNKPPGAGERTFPIMMQDPELLWGPEGSNFAVLRGSNWDNTGKNFMIIDIRMLRMIRFEYVD